MYKTQNIKNSRIEVADALRGIAIIGIIVYHACEKMNTGYPTPSYAFNWDHDLFKFLGTLISGKAYGIFAVLFGLTFFVQRDNQAQKGKDFSLRFLWRMVLLFLFGTINIAIFDGDILQSYALIGLLLIPAGYISNAWLWGITIFILLQPLEWITYFSGWRICSWADAQWNVISGVHLYGSFWDNVCTQLQVAPRNNWVCYLLTGRATQTLGLFLLGLLFGRLRLFYNEGNHLKIWSIVFGITLVLTLIGLNIDLSFGAAPGETSLKIILEPIVKAIQTLSYISGATLLWYAFAGFRHALRYVSFIGTMSLSNYLLSSIIGTFIFFGWGLGMSFQLGTTWCVLTGICIVILQILLLKLWARNHQRGPLETVWRKLTWLKF